MRYLYNAIALACCTILAIVFDCWWMIFLTVLFYSVYDNS
jgi:hypothetical protein